MASPTAIAQAHTSSDITAVPSFAYGNCGTILVYCATAHIPSDDDFQLWLTRLRKYDFDGLMVYAEYNGGLSPQQRQALARCWEGQVVPGTVMMTDSAIARGVLTAMRWLIPKCKRVEAVPLHDFSGAATALGVPEASEALLLLVMKLRAMCRASCPAAACPVDDKVNRTKGR